MTTWESVTTEMPRHSCLVNCNQARWVRPARSATIKRSGEHPPCHREVIPGCRESSDAATQGGPRDVNIRYHGGLAK